MAPIKTYLNRPDKVNGLDESFRRVLGDMIYRKDFAKNANLFYWLHSALKQITYIRSSDEKCWVVTEVKYLDPKEYIGYLIEAKLYPTIEQVAAPGFYFANIRIGNGRIEQLHGSEKMIDEIIHGIRFSVIPSFFVQQYK
jgi:hypothetical protein